MLIASSPVEIEAKAGEVGLSRETHDIALRMFHELTDLIAQATVAIGSPHEDWPKHRYYFAAEGSELSALLEGLRGRDDILDVTDGVPNMSGAPSGLYVRATDGSIVGVMVAHESHEGYLSSTR